MMFSRSLNKDLYGPSRVSARTAMKDVLLRDHVLQKGEWHENGRRNPWTTSFEISYKVDDNHLVALLGGKLPDNG